MDTNLLDILRDVLVVGYLFVIRVAVPLLLLVFWGAALKKRLEQRMGEERARGRLPVQSTATQPLAETAAGGEVL